MPESFYIILEGRVSIWTPVKPKAMLRTLKKLQKKVEVAITSKQKTGAQLKGFSFEFHLDPF